MKNNVRYLRQQWPDVVASKSPATPQVTSKAQLECMARLLDIVYSSSYSDEENWPEIRDELVKKISSTRVFVGRGKDPTIVYEIMGAEIPKLDIS